MKSSLKTSAVCTGLIVSGAALSAWAGARLLSDAELAVPLNPFGINRSPYGEVFAMAMQSPIEKEFHVGFSGHAGHDHAPGEPCNHPSHSHAGHNHAPDEPCDDPSHNHAGHNHAPDEPCDDPSHNHSDHADAGPPSSFPLESLIAAMKKGHSESTNPVPASPALKRHFLQTTERKLRFAYRLDPSNYANYTALQMFLFEGINQQPESTTSAASLARQTIDYCLAQEDDPRPALTAAAACSNLLLIMFNDHQQGHHTYDRNDMRRCLEQFDHCLERYQAIAESWIENGSWDRLSPARIEECNSRYQLNSTMREVAAETILRLEKDQDY